MSVLNVVDGCIPSDVATRNSAEIEEERRLLYVAMTRAKDALDLIVPQRFHVTQQMGLGDRHVCRAQLAIPNRLLGRFEQAAGRHRRPGCRARRPRARPRSTSPRRCATCGVDQGSAPRARLPARRLRMR